MSKKKGSFRREVRGVGTQYNGHYVPKLFLINAVMKHVQGYILSKTLMVWGLGMK